MAEFTEVWDEWKRMCKYKQLRESCRRCPLYNLECSSEHPKDQNNYDGHTIEEIVMGWAAEHQEPVYTTWFEWLENVGILPKAKSEYSQIYDTVLPTLEMYNPIPADLAEKLGLEPKEG